MTSPMSAAEVLDREFLEVRAELLRVAASLDRLDRSEGSVNDDPRVSLIAKSLSLLQSTEPNRAEQLQMLFSLPFDESWPSRFGLTVKRS